MVQQKVENVTMVDNSTLNSRLSRLINLVEECLNKQKTDHAKTMRMLEDIKGRMGKIESQK